MHFLRRDGERRAPAQLRGIIGVAVGEMPEAGIAVRPARNGAQMIDQMAKTGPKTVEQAPLRLANPARLFSIRHSQSCDSGPTIGKDRAGPPARLDRRTHRKHTRLTS